MGRKQQYSNDDFINAALALISESGPESVTVASIAKRLKAPVGSVYHRFSSRELIMAELWLRIAESFQQGFLELLQTGDCVRTSRYTVQWVRLHPRESKVLLLYRREELMTAEWPDLVKERAAKLRQELQAGILSFVQKSFGDISPENVKRTVFALTEIPLAAVKQYLVSEEKIPDYVDDLVMESCEFIFRRVL